MYLATQPPLLHGVLVAADPNGSILDLASGKVTRGSQRQEFWLDRRSGTLRLEMANLATGPFDVVKVLAPAALAAFDPNVAALELLANGDRKAIANGSARVTGTGSFAGSRVRWLRLELAGSSERVGISVSTGRPVEVGERGGLAWAIPSITEIPFTRNALTARRRARDGGGQVTFTLGIALSRTARVAGFRPVWLGPAFEGGKLDAVESSRIVNAVSPSERHARGLLFGYRSAGGGISVMEAQSPEYLGGLYPNQPVPGPGLAVLRDSVPLGAAAADENCTAQLRTHDLWVTIQGFHTRACARAARALRLRPPHG
jgi:hypothetical protein